MQHIVPTVTNAVNPFQSYMSPVSLERPLRFWKVSAQRAVWRDLADRPLLRTYDRNSGSQPDKSGDMYARAPNMPLSTSQAQRSTLQTQIRNYEWKATPYISFASSPEALENFANFRRTRPYRGNQTIVVIDPVVRLEAHRPVINYGDEIRYYNIKVPYNLSQEELDSHYICLWKVKADEVVGHWSWDELSSNPNWCEDVILPALRSFREGGRQYQAEEEVYNLSSALSALGLNEHSTKSSSGHGNSDEEVPKRLDERDIIGDGIRANL
ncbi:hypothetical protein FLAG1_06552 [Fusarium langsethiae]|uniref:DUF7587 domain-containing protein n=1 Tax=Fusarium langsethiae TaxID=179993 RepID=A0A0M9EVK9_FUSLA|nr:hypothetical protein FLAG1_06552 [Fusarium langsethiae]GKU04059.1 unnamed protein product [Fusarium langsethiae]GKU12260.1 unnamed protein product [Fusarium langsethiae]